MKNFKSSGYTKLLLLIICILVFGKVIVDIIKSSAVILLSNYLILLICVLIIISAFEFMAKVNFEVESITRKKEKQMYFENEEQLKKKLMNKKLKSILINGKFGEGKTTLLKKVLEEEGKIKELKPYTDNGNTQFLDYLFEETIFQNIIFYVLFLFICMVIYFVQYKYFAKDNVNILFIIFGIIVTIIVKNTLFSRKAKEKLVLWQLANYKYIIIDDIDRCINGNFDILKLVHFLYNNLKEGQQLIILGDIYKFNLEDSSNYLEKYVESRVDVNNYIAKVEYMNQIYDLGREEYSQKDIRDIYTMLEYVTIRNLIKIKEDILLANEETIYFPDKVFLSLINHDKSINKIEFLYQIENINRKIVKEKFHLKREDKEKIEKIDTIIEDEFKNKLSPLQKSYLKDMYTLEYQENVYINKDDKNKLFKNYRINKKVEEYLSFERSKAHLSISQLKNNWKKLIMNDDTRKEILESDNREIVKKFSTKEERIEIIKQLFSENKPDLFKGGISELFGDLYYSEIKEEFSYDELLNDDIRYDLISSLYTSFDDKRANQLIDKSIKVNDLSNINKLNLLIRDSFMKERKYYNQIIKESNYDNFLKLLIDVNREINFYHLFKDDQNIKEQKEFINSDLVNQILLKNLEYSLHNHMLDGETWDKLGKNMEKLNNEFKNYEVMKENKDFIQKRIITLWGDNSEVYKLKIKEV